MYSKVRFSSRLAICMSSYILDHIIAPFSMPRLFSNPGVSEAELVKGAKPRKWSFNPSVPGACQCASPYHCCWMEKSVLPCAFKLSLPVIGCLRPSPPAPVFIPKAIMNFLSKVGPAHVAKFSQSTSMFSRSDAEPDPIANALYGSVRVPNGIDGVDRLEWRWMYTVGRLIWLIWFGFEFCEMSE